MRKEFYTWKGIKFKAVPDAPDRGWGCKACAFGKVPYLDDASHPCSGQEQEDQTGKHCIDGHHYEAA